METAPAVSVSGSTGSPSENTSSSVLVETVNPLQSNAVVIDQLCSYLPSRDLMNCRLVNHPWNSSSVRSLKRRKAYNQVKLDKKAIVDFVNFLGSRKETVEWYEADIKFDLVLDSEQTTRNAMNQLECAQQLVSRFGKECLNSVEIRLVFNRPPWLGSSWIGVGEFCDSVTCLIADAKLPSLCLVIGEGSATSLMTIPADHTEACHYVTSIMDSPASIQALSFKEDRDPTYTSWPWGLKFFEQLLKQLHQVRAGILEELRWLRIQVVKPESFGILQSLKFDNLKSLELVLRREECKYPGDWTQEDWLLFHNFITDSCPALTLAHCRLKYHKHLSHHLRRSPPASRHYLGRNLPNSTI